MSDFEAVLIKHIHGCDDPKRRCEELLEFITVFHRSFVDNNKQTVPPHDRFPCVKDLLDKDDAFDKMIISLVEGGVLKAGVVHLKDHNRRK